MAGTSNTYGFKFDFKGNHKPFFEDIKKGFREYRADLISASKETKTLGMTIDDLRGEIWAAKYKRGRLTAEQDIRESNKLIKDMQQELKRLEGLPSRKFFDRFQKIPKSLGLSLGSIATFFSARAIVSYTKKSIQAYDKQMQAEAQLRASLQSTGYIAGKTFDRLKRQAGELQKKTRFGDETILSAQAQLLAFQNIRGKVYDQAVTAMADLSAKTGAGLKETALLIGKALDNPAKGMESLQRSGIRLSEKQKATIMELTDQGKTYEAQLMILGELQKRFGGSAEAAAVSGMGAWVQFKNSFGDFLEKIGGKLNKIAVPIIRGLSSLIKWVTDNAGALKNLTKITLLAGTAFLTFKVSAKLTGLTMRVFSTRAKTLGLVMGGLKTAVLGVGKGMMFLGHAIKSNPIGLILSATTTAVSAYLMFRKKVSGRDGDINNIKERARELYAENRMHLENLFDKLGKTNPRSAERNRLVDELVRMYPMLNKQMETDIRNTNNLSAAKQALIDKIAEQAGAEAAKESLYNIQKSIFADEMALKDAKERYDKAHERWSYTHIPGTPRTTTMGEVASENQMVKDAEKEVHRIENSLKTSKQQLEKIKTAMKGLSFDTGGSDFVSAEKEGLDAEANKQLDNIMGGGKTLKNIHIHVGNIIGTNNNHFTRGDDPAYADDFNEKLKNAIFGLLNDINYAY